LVQDAMPAEQSLVQHLDALVRVGHARRGPVEEVNRLAPLSLLRAALAALGQEGGLAGAGRGGEQKDAAVPGLLEAGDLLAEEGRASGGDVLAEHPAEAERVGIGTLAAEQGTVADAEEDAGDAPVGHAAAAGAAGRVLAEGADSLLDGAGDGHVLVERGREAG